MKGATDTSLGKEVGTTLHQGEIKEVPETTEATQGPAAEIDFSSDDGAAWATEDKFRESLALTEAKDEPATPAAPGAKPTPTAPAEAAGIYDGIPGADQIFVEPGAEAAAATPTDGKDKEAATKPQSAEASAEGEPEATAGTSSVALAELEQYFPGHVIKSAEDVKAMGAQVVETSATLNKFNELMEKQPELYALVAAGLEGKALEDAITEQFPHMAINEPDKATQPEAWADFQLKKKDIERRRQESAAKQSSASTTKAKRQQVLSASFQAFQKRQGLKGEDAVKAENAVKPFLTGAAFERGDFFDIVYHGLHREQELETARLEGRNSVIAEMKGGQTPSIQAPSKQRSMDKKLPLPSRETQQREITKEPLTRDERAMQHMATTFTNDGSIGDLLGEF